MKTPSLLLLVILGLVRAQDATDIPDTSVDVEEDLATGQEFLENVAETLDGVEKAILGNEVEKTSEPSQIIFTNSGPIQGKKVTPEGDESHYEFLGIPFAQPPVGRLRFMAPQPVRPWSQVLVNKPKDSIALNLLLLGPGGL